MLVLPAVPLLAMARMIVMAALDIGIVRQLTCKKCGYGVVGLLRRIGLSARTHGRVRDMFVVRRG